jgi:hypothetical protein
MRRLSQRFTAKLRKGQNQRHQAIRGSVPGPHRIALLIEFAKHTVQFSNKTWHPEDLPVRRRRFASAKEWLHNAGCGWCRACGRQNRKLCWHHIMLLSSGGSNAPKNLIKICAECHAQIHLHLQPPSDTDDALYRAARAIKLKPFDPTPRLVRNAPK